MGPNAGAGDTFTYDYITPNSMSVEADGATRRYGAVQGQGLVMLGCAP